MATEENTNEEIEVTETAEVTEAEEKKEAGRMDFDDPTDYSHNDEAFIEAIEEAKEDEEATDTEDSTEDVVEEEISQPDTNKELARTAAKLGMSTEEIAQMGSDEALEMVVSVLQRQSRDEAEETQNTSANDGDDNSAQDALRGSLDEVDALNPEEAFDPDAVKAIKTIKQELDQLKSMLVSAKQETADSRFDSLVMSLDEPWEDHFGRGQSETLDPNGEEAENRGRLHAAMETIKAGYQAQNRQVPDDAEIFTQALRMEFGDVEQEMNRRQVTKKVEKRESQLINRVQTNRSAPSDPRQRAVQNVADFMRDRGMIADPDEVFE